MTTIVGIQGDGFALIGCDSQVSDFAEEGYATQVVTLKESAGKIATNGRYLLGAAGDVRAINILHHAFTPPAAPHTLRGKKLDHFFTTKFIPALRECFESQGYAVPDKDDKEHMAEHNSSVIVAINNVIYTVEGDYSWYSDVTGMYALGTGAQYAMGALHALQMKTRMSLSTAKKYAMKALAAAAKFDPYTGAPYHVYVQGGDTPRKNGKPV